MSAANMLVMPSSGNRVQSIDLLRGAIMVLMVIDHVRVYSGQPPGGDTAGIFFTRWITHYCAPGFAFFAGSGAFLYGNTIRNKSVLSRYLLGRGLLLVLLELTLVRFSWTFNVDYSQFVLAGIIWMLGWCMVLMSALIWLKPVVVGIIGLAIMCGHQAFKFFPAILPSGLRASFEPWWQFVYPSAEVNIPFGIAVLYVLVPWIGVMAAGYGFGKILLLEPARRNRICWWIGLSAIFLFLVAGSIITYEHTPAENPKPFIFRLLNQGKYPPTQFYLLMTLGPLIALVPFAEKVKGWLAKVLITIGRVPLFYYLLHIPLIHLSAWALNLIREGHTYQQFYETAPFTQLPPEHRWGLGLLYLVFLVDVAILYFACRWYAAYKSAHPEKKWLKFI